MRTLSAPLAAAIAAESTTLCRLWRITRRDGTVLAFTDSVAPVTYNGTLYRSDISFTASAILISASAASSQSVTISIITDPLGLTESDLRARLYDAATGDIFIIDYTNPGYGAIQVFSGVVGTVRVSDKRSCSIDLLPKSAATAGSAIGMERYSSTCRNALGDSNCTVNLNALSKPFTVASSTGGVVVTAERNEASGSWALGFVTWATGANVGQTSKVQQSDGPSKTLFLISLPLNAIQVGDQGVVFPGCDKLIQTCRDKFNNVVNNRSEPFVPQKDVYNGGAPLNNVLGKG